MIQLGLAGVAGFLFAFGLAVSGMTDPQKVTGFLDITRIWNPALVFVMASAIPVFMAFWYASKPLRRPFFADQFHSPRANKIDLKLIAGSTLFGIGWGIAGICPGPAVASLGSGSKGAGVFIALFVIGSYLESALAKFTERGSP